VLLALWLALAACSSGEKPTLVEDASPDAAPAKTQGACDDVDPGEHLVAEATTDGPIAIYDAPRATTPSTSLANPKLINDDPNAPVPLVFLVKEAPSTDDCDWINVYLPVRPNGSTGWVRRDDVKVSKHDYRIEVHLGAFNLKVFEGDEIILDAPIAIARDNTPTPGGLYYTTELIQPPDPDTVYGSYAYGLSGYSEVLESFNGGPGQLGIHGTNEPDKIGTKVSSGCIRLRNEDIEQLADTLPLGVPVEIFEQ